MRRTFLTSVLSAAAALLLLSGCADLKDPVQNPVAATPIVHPAGWADPANAADPNSFHGTYLKYKVDSAWDINGCKSCHGSTFAGGSSQVSCFPCHDPYPHDVKFAGTSIVRGHVDYLRARVYPLESCKPCHGSDYFGGTPLQTQVSCGRCHRTSAGVPKSPEACNTCHGRFRGEPNDTASWAPPNALNNDTTITSRGVGAHQLHLRGTGITSATSVPCAGCHTVPTNIYQAGHFDTPGPAEVKLDVPLAQTPSGGQTPAPAYDPASQKCNNAFCHGAWKLRKANPVTYDNFYADTVMTGFFASPRWNGGASEAACGSCHGLPPKGHIAATIDQCGTCHAGVVDASGKIIDKTLHINGKVNVFNQEYSFK